jgi:hypothetical protein
VDHGVDGGRGELIDEYGVVVVLIDIDLLVEGIAEEQGLVVEINLDIHGRKLSVRYEQWVLQNRTVENLPEV